MNSQPADELRKIRMLMERSSIYHSLSGLSGVAAGAVGIIVYAAVYGIATPLLKKHPEMQDTQDGQQYLFKIFFGASLICLVLAFTAIFFFNRRKARLQGTPFFEPVMQKMFVNLFIPLLAGGIYVSMLFWEHQYLLMAPTMLIFYGLAMIQASGHTIAEIRYLGMAELILGLVAIFMTQFGMWFWLAGFGVLNMLYGGYIYLKYERN